MKDSNKENVLKVALKEYETLKTQPIDIKKMEKTLNMMENVHIMCGPFNIPQISLLREYIKEAKVIIAQYSKDEKTFEYPDVKYKNKIIESFNSDQKVKLYKSLQNGDLIMATSNERSAPNSIVSNYYTVSVNPKDKSYFDIEIKSIMQLLKDDNIPIKDVLNYSKNNDLDKTADTLEKSFPALMLQYDIKDVLSVLSELTFPEKNEHKNEIDLSKIKSIRCSALQDEKYHLVQNNEDLEYFKSFVPNCAKIEEDYGEIYGIIFSEIDGDIEELYITFDSAYYDLKSTYYPIIGEMVNENENSLKETINDFLEIGDKKVRDKDIDRNQEK